MTILDHILVWMRIKPHPNQVKAEAIMRDLLAAMNQLALGSHTKPIPIQHMAEYVADLASEVLAKHDIFPADPCYRELLNAAVSSFSVQLDDDDAPITKLKLD